MEIGSEATRLLFATVEGGEVRPHFERRLELSPARLGVRGLATRVEAEYDLARQSGAEKIHVMLAPELSRGQLTRGLRRRLESTGIGPPRLLTAAERGRLVFLGATAGVRPQFSTHGGALGVVELDPSFTAISVGREGQTARWWSSRPLSSRSLSEAFLRGDPPSGSELGVALEAAREGLSNLKPPRCTRILLTGSDASLLALACGLEIDGVGCDRALDLYAGRFSEILASHFDLAPHIARRIPAALLVAKAVGELLGEPLQIVHGGAAEGLLLSATTREVEADGAPQT